MDTPYYSASFSECLGSLQMAVFSILLLGMVGATALLILKAAFRARIAVSLGILAVAIFFYAGALEAQGLMWDHDGKSLGGYQDPQLLAHEYAKFYARLFTFRSLSVVAMIISAIGVAFSSSVVANQGRKATASPPPAT